MAMKVKKELQKDLKVETAKRIKKLKGEFSKLPILKVFENTEKYDQMVILANIEFAALCEHHQIEFHGIAHVGYLPKDSLIGISKLARVVEQCLNPTICTVQEKATKQILDVLKKALDPSGIMVVVKGKHGCVGYRGIKKPASVMITSAIDGAFKSELSGARAEFLSLITPQEKTLN
jgi:GTP cyclohydrolase I